MAWIDNLLVQPPNARGAWLPCDISRAAEVAPLIVDDPAPNIERPRDHDAFLSRRGVGWHDGGTGTGGNQRDIGALIRCVLRARIAHKRMLNNLFSSR